MRLEGWSALADCVAKLFCPSKRVRLIQDQASMRNVDSRIHSLRFDCCVFLFYSFSAVTFATKSALRALERPQLISRDAHPPKSRIFVPHLSQACRTIELQCGVAGLGHIQ